MTENHDYQTPEQGSLDWHVPLNDNFQKIDVDVEVRDVESAMDTFQPKAGAKFLAIDTGRRFIGDGDKWNELPYPQEERYLLVEATPGDVDYQLTVSGDARLGPLADPDAGLPDTISEDPDGNSVITGNLGRGDDDFYCTGTLVDAIATDPSALAVTYDGETIQVTTGSV
jgi:hypothetical protein